MASYQCEICGKDYGRKGALTLHVRNVHGIKDFSLAIPQKERYQLRKQRKAQVSQGEPPSYDLTKLEQARQKLSIGDEEIGGMRTDSYHELPSGELVQISPLAAQALIKIPFNLAAAVLDSEVLKLTESEKEELGGLFAEVYNLYAPEIMKKHGALVAFLASLSGVTIAKIELYNKEKKEKLENERREKERTEPDARNASTSPSGARTSPSRASAGARRDVNGNWTV